MPTGRPRTILDAFGARERRYVHLIGGGGKTSLMFALAHALADAGRSVLTSTSTRIGDPEPEESDRVVLGSDAASLVEALNAEFLTRRHVTVAASRLENEGKLLGLGVDQLDRLVEAQVAGHVLVEADGAAGRSLKAHREHEPLVSARAGLVIAVIGADCLGMPMDDRYVHRAELLRARLGRAPGSIITPEDVARAFFHRDGYLARIGKNSEVIVFVNKAGTAEALGEARRLAEALQRADREHRLDSIVVGDVRSGIYEERSRGQ
jgi:probable selenium-dependent hydroxylase accessory protein YqeC